MGLRFFFSYDEIDVLEDLSHNKCISVFVVHAKAGLRAVIGCVNMVSDRKTNNGSRR